MPATASVLDLQQEIEQLTARVDAIERNAGDNHLALGVLSGNLDTTIAAFIIALGATAYDIEVDMFFTFWAVAALRDPQKAAKKKFMEKMFGWMLPGSSRALPLSKMQMAGMGPKMIRAVMKQHGVKSLEQLMKDAAESGVRIHVCEMSMGVMGFKEHEMIDYPNLDFVGVGTFIQLISEAKQSFFL
ncbi:MAG: DsrE/DsrF/DrsH-like family protein [Acidobacteriaceae bacterium]